MGRRKRLAVVACLLPLLGWLIPRTVAERALERGPAAGRGVDSAAIERMARQARLAVAFVHDHPLARAVAPFHQVTAVWRDPDHCAPDEPGGADADRDYGATVRMIGWFGIPGRTLTLRCGGASWHEGTAVPRRRCGTTASVVPASLPGAAWRHLQDCGPGTSGVSGMVQHSHATGAPLRGEATSAAARSFGNCNTGRALLPDDHARAAT